VVEHPRTNAELIARTSLHRQRKRHNRKTRFTETSFLTSSKESEPQTNTVRTLYTHSTPGKSPPSSTLPHCSLKPMSSPNIPGRMQAAQVVEVCLSYLDRNRVLV
jgi:hypothetical protein